MPQEEVAALKAELARREELATLKEELAKRQSQEPQEEPWTKGRDFLGGIRTLGAGISMGTTDEAEARIRSLFSDRPYEDIVKDVRGEIAQYGKKHPYFAPVVDAYGSLAFNPLGKAKTAGQAVGILGRGAKEGAEEIAKRSFWRQAGENSRAAAGEGAIEGFNRGDGGFINRLGTALEGAVTSAVAAPVVQSGIRGVSKLGEEIYGLPETLSRWAQNSKVKTEQGVDAYKAGEELSRIAKLLPEGSELKGDMVSPSDQMVLNDLVKTAGGNKPIVEAADPFVKKVKNAIEEEVPSKKLSAARDVALSVEDKLAKSRKAKADVAYAKLFDSKYKDVPLDTAQILKTTEGDVSIKDFLKEPNVKNYIESIAKKHPQYNKHIVYKKAKGKGAKEIVSISPRLAKELHGNLLDNAKTDELPRFAAEKAKLFGEALNKQYEGLADIDAKYRLDSDEMRALTGGKDVQGRKVTGILQKISKVPENGDLSTIGEQILNLDTKNIRKVQKYEGVSDSLKKSIKAYDERNIQKKYNPSKEMEETESIFFSNDPAIQKKLKVVFGDEELAKLQKQVKSDVLDPQKAARYAKETVDPKEFKSDGAVIGAARSIMNAVGYVATEAIGRGRISAPGGGRAASAAVQTYALLNKMPPAQQEELAKLLTSDAKKEVFKGLMERAAKDKSKALEKSITDNTFIDKVSRSLATAIPRQKARDSRNIPSNKGK